MPDYTRLVSYIYNYEDGLKRNNVGYARIEARNGQCKCTLHITAPSLNEKQIKAYLFTRKDGDAKGILFGTFQIRNGVGEYKTVTESAHVMHSPYNITDMGGIVLHYTDNKFFATEWDDVPITMDMVSNLDAKPGEKKEVAKQEDNRAAISKNETENNIKLNQESMNAVKDRPMGENRQYIEYRSNSQNREYIDYKNNQGNMENRDNQFDRRIREEIENQRQQEERRLEERRQEERRLEERRQEKRREEERRQEERREEERRLEEKRQEEKREEERRQEEKREEERQQEERRLKERWEEERRQEERRLKERLEEEKRQEERKYQENINRERSDVRENIENKKEQTNRGILDERIFQENRETIQQRFNRNYQFDYDGRPEREKQLERGNDQDREDLLERGNNQDRENKFDRELPFDRDNEQDDENSYDNEQEQDNNRTFYDNSRDYMNERIPGEDQSQDGMNENCDHGDTPSKDNMGNIRQNYEEHPIAKRIYNSFPRMYPFEDNDIAWCVRIEPQDIGILPMEAWVLGNNSFLLHSYFSYRHLIFARINDRNGLRYILGVPGIYHNREKFMAKMFGFENFKCVKRKELKTGEFGYWYIPIYLN